MEIYHGELPWRVTMESYQFPCAVESLVSQAICFLSFPTCGALQKRLKYSGAFGQSINK